MIPLDRLGAIVKNRDDGRQLADFGQHLRGQRLHRHQLAGVRIHQRDFSAPRRFPASREQPRYERREVRVVGADDALRVLSRSGHHGEQALGRIVHERNFALLIRDDDRVRHGIDQQVQTVSFGAYLGFRGAQLGVVLVDLPRREAQVRDIAQDRDHAGAFPRIAHDRAQQLEQQIRSFRRIDEEQLAAAGFSFAERGTRQRGRKEHVVQLHRAASAFGNVVGSGEQHLGSRVGDDELPFHIGEKNRIGGRVDDVEEERVLAPQPRVFFAESRLHATNAQDAAAQRFGHPLHVGRLHVGGRTDDEESDCGLIDARGADLDGGERAVAQKRHARVLRAVKRYGRAVGQRADEGIIGVFERQRKPLHLARRDAGSGDAGERTAQIIGGREDRPLGARMGEQPFGGALRGGSRIRTPLELFEQRQLRLC